MGELYRGQNRRNGLYTASPMAAGHKRINTPAAKRPRGRYLAGGLAAIYSP